MLQGWHSFSIRSRWCTTTCSSRHHAKLWHWSAGCKFIEKGNKMKVLIRIYWCTRIYTLIWNQVKGTLHFRFIRKVQDSLWSITSKVEQGRNVSLGISYIMHTMDTSNQSSRMWNQHHIPWELQKQFWLLLLLRSLPALSHPLFLLQKW